MGHSACAALEDSGSTTVKGAIGMTLRSYRLSPAWSGPLAAIALVLAATACDNEQQRDPAQAAPAAETRSDGTQGAPEQQQDTQPQELAPPPEEEPDQDR